MTTKHDIYCGDCLEILPTLGRVDLVMTSPPYWNKRSYGIGYNLKREEWADWAADRYIACHESCPGLTAWVVGNTTDNFQWEPEPMLLMWRLLSRGVGLRIPPIYKRNGIPGSGSVDWLANCWEWIVCATHGKLPWSDNTAMGHPPKCKPGGAPSHRKPDGRRYNARPQREGDTRRVRSYKPPKIANPGNVIDCGAVGGGNIGSKLASENEAPFPESLAEFFIRAFCPPGGTVLDPFCGSGTTASVAMQWGRNSISIDLRESQCELTERRLQETRERMLREQDAA